MKYVGPIFSRPVPAAEGSTPVVIGTHVVAPVVRKRRKIVGQRLLPSDHAAVIPWTPDQLRKMPVEQHAEEDEAKANEAATKPTAPNKNVPTGPVFGKVKRR